MGLLTIIQTALSFFFIITIFDCIFGSIREAIHKQSVLQGKLIFFIYSLIVYYGKFKMPVLFWEFFVNEPIRQAYGMINFLTTNLLNIPIDANPSFIFKYLIPAVFIYYFAEYWLRYAFMDRRLSKMVSLAAVVLLFKSNMSIGLINWATIPIGLPLFGPASVAPVISFYSAIDSMVQRIVELPATGNLIALSIIGLVLLILIFIVGSFAIKGLFKGFYKSQFGGWVGLIMFLASAFLIVFPLVLYALMSKASPGVFTSVFIYSWAFVALLALFAVVGELLFFGAMSMFSGMMRKTAAFKEIEKSRELTPEDSLDKVLGEDGVARW